MGEHLVLCRLTGTGDPDPAQNAGFGPDLPPMRWRKADVPEDDDQDHGYFAVWATCDEARLDELIADGLVVSVVHRDPDPQVAGAASFSVAALAAAAADVPGAAEVPGFISPTARKSHEGRVAVEARKLPQREGLVAIEDRERPKRGLPLLPRKVPK